MASPPALLVGHPARGDRDRGLASRGCLALRGLHHRGLPDAGRGLHLERPRRPGDRRGRRAHPLAPPALGPGQPARGARLDRGAVASGLPDPPDLPPGRHRARGGLARARGGLPLRQALHLVAAGVPRPRLQLGGAPALGGACGRARAPAGASLPRGDRLDAALRHDLRPSGPRGRRPHRRQVDGPALRAAHGALAVGLHGARARARRRGRAGRRGRGRPGSRARRGSPGTWPGRSCASTSTTRTAAWRSSARRAGAG